MKPKLNTFRRFLGNRSGATAIEYGLIVATLSLVIVASITQTGNSVRDMFMDPARAIQSTLD
jgi:pilus assembly protein Flp/PilA